MTDNEIIKCLRHCRAGDCEECKALGVCNATFSFHKNALDLINRQKEKNESLKVDLAKCSIRLDNLYKTADEIKSEAIKEFAEKLKKRFYLCAGRCVVDVYHIDNLVKEMTDVEK